MRDGHGMRFFFGAMGHIMGISYHGSWVYEDAKEE